MESKLMLPPQARQRLDGHDDTTADAVESLLLVLLALPVVASFAIAAVQLIAWLLRRGLSFAAMAGAALAVGVTGAFVFGGVSAFCRHGAPAWSARRRAG